MVADFVSKITYTAFFSPMELPKSVGRWVVTSFYDYMAFFVNFTQSPMKWAFLTLLARKIVFFLLVIGRIIVFSANYGNVKNAGW